MAGYFELMDSPDGGYRVALIDSGDYLVAMSVTFPDGAAAARGIALIREIAGTGLVKDRRHGHDEVASMRRRHAARAPSNAARDHGKLGAS